MPMTLARRSSHRLDPSRDPLRISSNPTNEPTGFPALSLLEQVGCVGVGGGRRATNEPRFGEVFATRVSPWRPGADVVR